MNEIIALQKYENEAQLAKELIRGFWLAHGDYVITDEEAAENLAAWTDKGHMFYFILKEEIPMCISEAAGRKLTGSKIFSYFRNTRETDTEVMRLRWSKPR